MDMSDIKVINHNPLDESPLAQVSGMIEQLGRKCHELGITLGVLAFIGNRASYAAVVPDPNIRVSEVHGDIIAALISLSADAELMAPPEVTNVN